MAVYVDDLYKKYGRMKMSHMIADSKTELLDMVDKIGIKRKWIQKEGTVLEHFDVSMAKRQLAISNGAIAITWRELGQKIIDRKNGKQI